MAHPCQALSSGTIQWQQGHLRALSPGHSPSWHCHQPHRLRAGGGQQAPAQHPLPWPGSLHLSRPVLKGTASGDAAPLPPAQSSPSCSRPKACRFAFWRPSLELSPLGLPSPTSNLPTWHHFLPGNRKPGILAPSRESSPPHLCQLPNLPSSSGTQGHFPRCGSSQRGGRGVP